MEKLITNCWSIIQSVPEIQVIDLDETHEGDRTNIIQKII